MSWARFCVPVFLMAGCVHARLLILRVFCTDAQPLLRHGQKSGSGKQAEADA